MKKTIITITAVIIVFILTIIVYHVASNINVYRGGFDSFLPTEATTQKKTNTTPPNTTTNMTTTKYASIDVDMVLKNVKKEDGKVNIYFFYGDGCPHCEKEHQAFAEIKDEYGKYYNLYEFEIWYNKTNNSLAHIFAENMNVELKGVPFTVIGEKNIRGFGEGTKQLLIEYIKEEKDKDFDLYFDKIKEQ